MASRSTPWIVFVLWTVSAPALAQESPSFRLHEHALNAGGRPAQGTIATSASFRITLDAIGTPVATADLLAGTAFGGSAGFVAGLRPTGEVEDLRFTGPVDLVWLEDRAVGDYVVYRGPLVSYGGAGWGDCTQWGLTHPAATDLEVPSSGSGFQYLIGARNRLHEVGPLGATSGGVERTASTICP